MFFILYFLRALTYLRSGENLTGILGTIIKRLLAENQIAYDRQRGLSLTSYERSCRSRTHVHTTSCGTGWFQIFNFQKKRPKGGSRKRWSEIPLARFCDYGNGKIHVGIHSLIFVLSYGKFFLSVLSREKLFASYLRQN